MTTIHEELSYTVEYTSNRTRKTAGFFELERAQEYYAEKYDERKNPKLFVIRKTMTREQVKVK